MSARTFDLPYEPVVARDARLAYLGFTWVGDLLSVRGHTVAYVASYQLDVLDESGEPTGEKFTAWHAQEKHGLKVRHGGYFIDREMAVKMAERHIIEENDLLIEIVEELFEIRQR